MAVPKRVKNYLKQNRIKYKILRHGEVYTSQELAAVQHVPGKSLAKVVILKTQDGYVMAVLPACYSLLLKKLKKILRAKTLRLAKENEIGNLFPDCEIGAMPPFGNLYEMPVYVDESMSGVEDMVFEAGNHTHTIRMKYKDFERIVQHSKEEFAEHL